jgi:hypothetical protein
MEEEDNTRTRGLPVLSRGLLIWAHAFSSPASSKTYGLVDIFVTIESGDGDVAGGLIGIFLDEGVFLPSKRFFRFGFESSIGERSNIFALDNFEKRCKKPGGLVMPPGNARCRIVSGVEHSAMSPIVNDSTQLARDAAFPRSSDGMLAWPDE